MRPGEDSSFWVSSIVHTGRCCQYEAVSPVCKDVLVTVPQVPLVVSQAAIWKIWVGSVGEKPVPRASGT